MNLHQVLTGASNDGNKCFAVGSIDGQHFTAYAAGCNIVILDGKFNRVQIISGFELGYTSELTCLSCCKDYGKIVASYGNKVRIFEPVPVIRAEGKKTLNYQWSQTSLITLEEVVEVLTWNSFGGRLLISSGKTLQIWEESDTATVTFDQNPHEPRTSGFFIGDFDGNGPPHPHSTGSQMHDDDDEIFSNEWKCIWKTSLANPVVMMKFSSDGSLFATTGKNDRLVKIWYENVKVSKPSQEFAPSNQVESTSFSFVYVAHPRTVTGFSWRQTSRYIQRGILANMLLTSCKDAICRIWCETFLPDDGLFDARQATDTLHSGFAFGQPGTRRNSHHHNHKHRLVQRLAHIRKVLHKKKRRQGHSLSDLVHQSHGADRSHAENQRQCNHHSDVAVELHFHLAASIDFGADIPTIGSFSDGCCPSNFVTHWLNNKEFHTNLLVENLLENVYKKSSSPEGLGREGESTNREESWEDLGSGTEEMNGSHKGFQNVGSDPSINEKHQRLSRLGKAKTFVSVEAEKSLEGSTGHASSPFHSEDNLGHERAYHSPGELESDEWERQIDHMIMIWNETSDVLFSIHPTDGSLLIWTVQFLDEAGPGMFRQAQVHFNSRLPRAFPAYDASTMLATPWVYYESSSTLESHIMHGEGVKSSEVANGHQQVKNPFLPSSSKLSLSSPLPPRVFLLSKHSNGSLNLWDVTFTEESRFSNAVGVTHVARVCGHRYHTNSAICHPVLPLLLTTSHLGNGHDCDSDVHENGYCSELILWKVDPIGPLSRSGGINELARVNSSVCSAFADVSWIPSLLPDRKTSPSSLFVASDGSSLHIYQAVFDARSLLEDMRTSLKKEAPLSPIGDEPWTVQQAFEEHSNNATNGSAHRIISHQSTSRPGCIIDLMPIEDTYRSWHQIQLMHVFQERMVFTPVDPEGRKGERSSKQGGEGSFVDLQDSSHFQEKFYLVVFQKLSSPSSGGGSSGVSYGTVVFTWEITVACSAARSFTGDESGLFGNHGDLGIASKKVCQQLLPLPEGVSVTSATVAVGHLCSSSIYPACFAPYLVSTACSNGEVYFWNCSFESDTKADDKKLVWKQWEMMSSAKDSSSSIQVGGQLLFVSCAYSGRVAVAYKVGGSVAGYSRQDYDSQQEYLKDLFSNLKVAIYQCEATGGSEWTLEDTIPLRTISLPELKFDIDPHFLYDFDRFVHHSGVVTMPSVHNTHHHHHHHHHYPHPQTGHGSSAGLHHLSHDHARPVLPSCTSLHNLRRALSTKSPKLLAQRARPFVFLDWISAEDGTHVLTVGVGSQIILYGPASLEMARTVEAKDRLTDVGSTSSTKSSSGRGKLQKSATLVAPNRAPQVIRWIKLRTIDLYTADGLAPFPVHISWVRSGILVVGMDNEMHVFSQWPDLDSPLAIGQSKANGEAVKSGAPIKEDEMEEDIAENEKASVKDESKGLLPRTQSLVSAMTKSMSTAWLVDAVFKDPKKEAMEVLNGNLEHIQGLPPTDGTIPSSNNILDEVATLNRVGLFEASRLACPTLPQYHPKQLLELLNFGKVKRVKAILWHLLRCVADADDESSDSEKPGKPKSQTSTCFGQVSIAPLPLYALLSADDSSGGRDRKQRADEQSIMKSVTLTAQPSDQKNDYDALFDLNFDLTLEENPFIDLDPDASAAKEQQQQLSRKAASGLGPSGTFGPSQAQLLSGYLTRSSLPGLTGLDQMYLLALAETVAHTKLDFKEGPSSMEAGRANGHILQRSIPSSPEPSSAAADAGVCFLADASVDDCGLRYLLATRHHMHLINSLPLAQRLQLQRVGLASSEFIWAFHSDSQEELLNTLPCVQKGNPTWKELKQFGVGWWLRNVTSLSRCMEKVAKAAFQESKDPLDSALLYLAMKKKNVLWGLFRSVNNTRMAQFFKNNFSEDRWRRAALKNAFALIGLQKFQCAAAFFLLAGSITDAIEVCLKNLNDFQLAMVVLRLYEGDLGDNAPPAYKKLLLEKILGGSLDRSHDHNDEGRNSDELTRSPDPFLRSMAYWIFLDYAGSLSTLLESASGGSLCDDYRALLERHDFGRLPSSYRSKPLETRGLGYAGSNLGKSIDGPGSGTDESVAKSTAMSSVFNFYVYLRTHPLILRQQAALGRNSKTIPSDCITTSERRLYFLTAHEHFKNGCPALALEVLMKLPPYIVFPEEAAEETANQGSGQTGKDSEVQSSAKKAETSKVQEFDWGKPVSDASIPSKVEDFDWSQPLASRGRFGGDDDDDDDELKLDFGLDDDDDEGDDDDIDIGDSDGKKQDEKKVEETKVPATSSDDDDPVKMNKRSDIMAQQLKFVACLNMIADELATLASGYGVDGGQLRFHLYYWLEKEVQVLKKVCNYCPDLDDDWFSATTGEEDSQESNIDEESVKAERSPSPWSGFKANEMSEARDSGTTRRHAWLRTNHNLLVTLLSYTILHGSSGGGFASVRTEILLLLQELQERNSSNKKVVFATPSLTKVPLLNSNLSSSRTVVADLVQYLQNMCHDLLATFSDMPTIPDAEYPQHKIYYIFSIGTALSACMYQSLSDNESFMVLDKQNTVGLDDFFSSYERRRSSHLVGGAEGRTVLSSVVEPPKTDPSEWPGVASLTLLIKQNKDEDLPQMNVLLLESLLSVYLSLLCYAMASYDAPVLCRLVGRPLGSDCWGVVFGGGVKQLVKMAPEGNSQPKHRVKLAVKTIGPQAFQQRFADTRSTYQEKFVPPKMSIIDYFLSKPSQEAGTSRQQQRRKEDDSNDDSDTSHDSENDEEYENGGIDDDNDDSDDFKSTYKIKTKKEPKKKVDKMHVDPRSLPWQLMRYAVLKFVNMNLKAFLPAVGFNPTELAHTSSNLNAVVKNLSRWETNLKEELDANPGNLSIPGLYAEPTSMFGNITAQKYNSILDPQNTPFLSKHRSAKPAKKLWHALVCKEQLKDVFIKYAFKGKDERYQLQQMPEMEPMKIIHKDQEVITSFAINQMHLNCIAMATHKEIIEVNMSKIVEPPDWLGHDIDYDIEVIQNPMSHGDKPEDFLLLRSPHDSKIMNGALGPSSPEGTKGSSGASTVILKRPDAGVRRLAAHPLQPIYVSGADDGCVKLWEWGHPNMVAEVRKSGAFPKVTMVAFNDHGNKIGISDVEGSLCLWQVGDRTTLNKPYLSMKCHSKTTHCFTFLGCSSLLCTSGHSADSRNVALWDTLLPQRKMLVQSFPCHSDGAPSVIYAPNHQLVISGGKKGEICIFDVRQRQLRHTFQAHNSAVKCLTIDPSEEFFVSGAADGDVKVWSLTVHNLLHSFTAEHSKASSNLFRNATSGVIQVTLNSRGHLFSCGNDGTMKIRRLFHSNDGIGRASMTNGRSLFDHRGDIVQTWGKTY